MDMSAPFFHKKAQSILILSIIFFATLTRFAIPPFFNHLPNFSPIDATALFCGAYFTRRIQAIGVILLSVFIGDILLNKMYGNDWVFFYPGFYWQYSCYILMTGLGARLSTNIKVVTVVKTSILAALLFFIVSNFGVWMNGHLYPKTIEGLISCYYAAIPFFKNTLLSDVIFSMVLFGIYENLFKSHFMMRYNR